MVSSIVLSIVIVPLVVGNRNSIGRILEIHNRRSMVPMIVPQVPFLGTVIDVMTILSTMPANTVIWDITIFALARSEWSFTFSLIKINALTSSSFSLVDIHVMSILTIKPSLFLLWSTLKNLDFLSQKLILITSGLKG